MTQANQLFPRKAKNKRVRIDTFSRRLLREFEEVKSDETSLSFRLLFFANRLHLDDAEEIDRRMLGTGEPSWEVVSASDRGPETGSTGSMTTEGEVCAAEGVNRR